MGTSHEVCSKQLPPCNLSEKDLLQNPHFSKLLLSLAQHVDESGLSLTLAKEQAQVRALGGGMIGGRENLPRQRSSYLGFFWFSRHGRKFDCIKQHG